MSFLLLAMAADLLHASGGPMEQQFSRFQEQIALFLGAGTLLGLAFGRRRPIWGGIMLFGVGSLLLRSGVGWLRSSKSDEKRPRASALSFDIVTETSEESFPASDPPSFALGVR
jgi:hypothetical protein